jgi:uncharacterized membrane protein
VKVFLAFLAGMALMLAGHRFQRHEHGEGGLDVAASIALVTAAATRRERN